MRTMLVSLSTVLVLVVGASPAAGGGWATAGLAPPPEDVQAGDTWIARVKILQHGRTPLAGVEPTITIRNDDSGAAQTYAARPTATVGVYEARVKLPAGGTWRYEVNDAFLGGRVHTFGPFDVGEGAGESFTFLQTALVLLAALALLAGAAVAVTRMRRSRPVPALR